MSPQAFVAGLHLRWDGVRQRPQHLLSRLARQVPVVVVEEPFPAGEDRDDVRAIDGLTVVRPLRRRGWAPPFVDDEAVATVRVLLGARRAGVWLYTPMMSELIDAFGATPVVVDVMDELAAFDHAPAGIADRERALLTRADLVFTGGRTLYAGRRGYGAKVHEFASGVEFERFNAPVAPLPAVAMLRGPVLAYVGVIDERLDYPLIAALADALPAAQIVLAGPVVKVAPSVLPLRTNVHFTGALPYASLPSLLAGVDVALMPFARNRATASISPTKTLEYLAAGVPVVSTPIADVVAAYGDAVAIADGPEAFAAAVRTALAAPVELRARGVELARAHGWDAIFERMWSEVTRSEARAGGVA